MIITKTLNIFSLTKSCHYYNDLHICVLKKITVFSLLSFLLCAVSVQAQMLSIRGENVNLRSGPGTKYSIKWEYGSGFPVEITDKKGNWLKTRDFENDTGWVHKSFLVNRPQMIVKANKGKDEKVNIRKGPGQDYKVIGKAYYGVVFKTLRLKKGWVEVEHESGLTGWISTNLLWGF
ncbi:MAG: SH3 domain-containing protein [Desulforhopalus sp.]